MGDVLVLDSSAKQTPEHIAKEALIAQKCRKFINDNADVSVKGSRPCAYVVGVTMKSLKSLANCVARRKIEDLSDTETTGNTVPIDIGVGVIACGLCRR
eukprot:gnl/Chilomastix_caulleri/1606.p1 GENE.gnl/Chilomastix_caulleri/1606~~gnl/Chilomastix_caulleri/1606.p1  ORF type:complete len:99 (+),score=29.27 gnl/Chilomastix_caulleri/1606:169-465(+)